MFCTLWLSHISESNLSDYSLGKVMKEVIKGKMKAQTVTFNTEKYHHIWKVFIPVTQQLTSHCHIYIFTAYLWHGWCQNGYLQLGQGVLEVLLLLLSQLDPESRRQQQGNLCSGPLLTAIKQKQTSWWIGSSHVPVCIYDCMWVRGGLFPPTTHKGIIGDFICAFCYIFLCISL